MPKVTPQNSMDPINQEEQAPDGIDVIELNKFKKLTEISKKLRESQNDDDQQFMKRKTLRFFGFGMKGFYDREK